jgi:hypothetical protein
MQRRPPKPKGSPGRGMKWAYFDQLKKWLPTQTRAAARAAGYDPDEASYYP